jgi:hypothetical protein
VGLCRIRSFVLMVLFPFGVFDTLGSSYDFVIDLLKVIMNMPMLFKVALWK